MGCFAKRLRFWLNKKELLQLPDIFFVKAVLRIKLPGTIKILQNFPSPPRCSVVLPMTQRKDLFMNIKDRMILGDFRKTHDTYVELSEVVYEKLKAITDNSDTLIMGLEHRVKTEKSLEGKLYRSGDRYQKLTDLTDLVGARVILYFSDDVDKIGKLVEQTFDIDWTRSSDKRALLDPDTFGYLSLHYVCSLPKDFGYREELSSIRFEIQIRSILQHAWAQINHDMGYKSQFGIPRTVVREFARLSGLLELADDEFIRARDHISLYIAETREKIKNDNAGDVLIDLNSLREYMLYNKSMRTFLNELAGIENSNIAEIDPEGYIEQLKWLGITTIGQLQEMLGRDRRIALALAKRVLTGSELDILASNAALRFLCRAELLIGNYTEKQAAAFIELTAKTKERAARQAKRLFKMYENIQNEVTE